MRTRRQSNSALSRARFVPRFADARGRIGTCSAAARDAHQLPTRRTLSLSIRCAKCASASRGARVTTSCNAPAYAWSRSGSIVIDGSTEARLREANSSKRHTIATLIAR